MKKLSPKKIEERRERREKAKKERIILSLSATAPFILTVVTIVLYACKITPAPRAPAWNNRLTVVYFRRSIYLRL